jgi:hypothetical protein
MISLATPLSESDITELAIFAQPLKKVKIADLSGRMDRLSRY